MEPERTPTDAQSERRMRLIEGFLGYATVTLEIRKDALDQVQASMPKVPTLDAWEEAFAEEAFAEEDKR